MRLGLFPGSETAPASGAASSTWNHPGFHRQQTLALQLFAGELAGATDCFCFLPGSPLGRLFIVAAQHHLAEETFALHLLLQRLEGLADIVVADENLHAAFLLDSGDQDTDMDGSGPDSNCGTNAAALFCRERWPHLLRERARRCAWPGRNLHRPDSSRGKASGSSGADVGQV